MYLFQRVWLVVVVLEEVEDGGSQHLEGDASVSVKVEPVEHLHAAVAAPGIVLGQLLEDVDLQLGRLAILLHVLDYLERDYLVLVDVPHFDHLAKRALSERGEDFEAVLYEVPVRIDQVSILVILYDRPLAANT